MAMNEQKAPMGIEWTRIPNSDGTIRRGFTWNPIAGCLHDCQWNIAGQRAECYAKTIAEKFTAFRWYVQAVNGRDVDALERAFASPSSEHPSLVIAEVR